MKWVDTLRFRAIKDLGAPAALRLMELGKRRRRRPPAASPFGPPLDSTARLKQIMTRHYLLARYATGAHPVAWVTSGAPVELLRVFGYYTIYPENHSALCGARKVGAQYCEMAEQRGYSRDLCSYARIDIGAALEGRSPAGRLPRPDLMFCTTNICQTVLHWYRVLAHHWHVPLVVIDTPFVAERMRDHDVAYIKRQLEESIPVLERNSGRRYSEARFHQVLTLAKETSLLWGQVLETMRARPSPMSIFDAFGHLAPVVSLRGLPVARAYYLQLLAELQQRVRQGVGAIKHERKRLMWDNIAIWYRVKDLATFFAERGMNFVTATYTNAWAETSPRLDPARPFESVAYCYGEVILNNNLNHRLDLMARLIGEYAIDGLVVHSARSCKPYSVGQYDIKRRLLERHQLPSVVIEADIADERAFDEGKTRLALESFVELLDGNEASHIRQKSVIS